MIKDIEVVRSIVEPALRSVLSDKGIEKVTVVAGLDHSDEPVVFADIFYGADASVADGVTLIQAANEAMARLSSKGDDRFVHVTHHFLEQDEHLGSMQYSLRPSGKRRLGKV
jgi:hypothetical protein